MEITIPSTLCEVLEIKPGVYRLYCEELSEEREQEIINLDIGKVISKCSVTRNGALRIDYDADDHKHIVAYFKHFIKSEKDYGGK